MLTNTPYQRALGAAIQDIADMWNRTPIHAIFDDPEFNAAEQMTAEAFKADDMKAAEGAIQWMHERAKQLFTAVG